jgi:hypothetical protein
MQVLLEGRDRGFDDQVVLTSDARSPQDETDCARSPAIDQELTWLDHLGIGHLRIGDRDPLDVEVGREDH